MNMIENKPLVIYHGNCADGFGAAWCFWNKYKDGVDFHPGTYSKDPPDVTGRDVYLVDFSYKRAVVEKMLETANSITLIDHHKTAIEDLEPLFNTTPKFKNFTSMDNSGAMLAWKFLYGDAEPPKIIKHIEDRDLWKFELEGTRFIQSHIFSQPYDFQVWDEMMTQDVNDMILSGTAIERKQAKDIDELLKVCQRTMNIANWDVPAASLPYTMSSDAGHIMAKGKPFAACYWDTADGRVFSLRSSPEGMDVSEIASHYGGGGHKHASGFKVPRDHELARS